MRHLYGIPVFYNNQTKTLEMVDFVCGLLWRTSDPVEYDPASAIVSLFPSWSWASIKAAQPSGAGSLSFVYVHRISEDMAVSIEHQNGEEMGLLHFMTTCHPASYFEF